MQTLTLLLSDRTPPAPAAIQPHPYSYANATLPSLPPRFYIEHHSVLGHKAYFTPLTPSANGDDKPVAYSDYHPTADLALAAHLPNYIEDLIAYEAFQTLLALSQRFDGQAVIDAFELLKDLNPDDDYYLDAAAGRVPPISEL
ncbi:MAG: hypothetical protein AAGF93_00365 [Cyanobacteria bacterium P01_H01_bin.105]